MNPKLSISEQLIYSTVRITCENNNGTSSIGTGFFFEFHHDKSRRIPTIISNNHVVELAEKVFLHFNQKDDNGFPSMGVFDRFRIDDFHKYWIPHPDNKVDLGILPIAPLLNMAKEKDKYYFQPYFTKDIIPNKEQTSKFDALEEIIMVGYPKGIMDRKNNMPVFRRGITATHPIMDYEGRREFLVDAASFPGSSGSPIIIYNPSGYTDKKGRVLIGKHRLFLLGILYAGWEYSSKGDVRILPIPTNVEPRKKSNAFIPANLGVAIKAERILDFEALLPI